MKTPHCIGRRCFADMLSGMENHNAHYIVVYGIACVRETDGMIEIIDSIPDVTTSREAIEGLVSRCNEYRLAPEHLSDAVIDLIG